MIFGWRGDRKEISEMIGRGGRILKVAFPMDSLWHRQNLGFRRRMCKQIETVKVEGMVVGNSTT
jgi:hypothetical protein